ncbi:MAG: trigger factor [Candidatus Nanopelagicales bacterium]
MKSAVETLSPTRVKLTVEVPFEELKPALDSAYKRIAAQVNIPGFRKGKVPARIIDQRIGRAAVLEEAVNDAVGANLDAAVREHQVKLLGRPEVEVGDIKDNEPLEFTAEADVVPDFDLPDYDGLEVTVDAADVLDEDVDKQLDALRSRFGTLLPVERASEAGDVLLFDMSGDCDGASVEDLVATALSYELGSEGMIPGFDDAVTGASAGEERGFDFVPDAGEYEGRTIVVTVTVTTVRERKLPPVDDDFAQLASEFDTIEELKDDLKNRVGRVKVLEQAYAAREKVSEALLAAVEIPIPEGVLAAQVEQHFSDGHGDDDHREAVATEVRESFKSQLVLDKIADIEKLTVSESELSSWLVAQAPRYGLSPDQFAQELVQSGQVSSAVSEVRRSKALAHVLEHAKIVDSRGQLVDLSDIDGDDLIADFGHEDEHDHENDVEEHDHEHHDHDDHDDEDHKHHDHEHHDDDSESVVPDQD